MPLRGKKVPVVNTLGSKELEKAVYESRPGHLQAKKLCYWIVHECNLGIKWISVLVLSGTVFVNPITVVSYCIAIAKGIEGSLKVMCSMHMLEHIY